MRSQSFSSTSNKQTLPNPGDCPDVTIGFGITSNDLSGPCKNLTLIFARGTSEEGNLGGIVGPPFIQALKDLVGTEQLAVQGVNDYPADVEGFNEGGSPSGSRNMAKLIGQALEQCPNTKLCVSGYSQGAQVAHNAANMLSQSQSDFINSVVLFGDPDDGKPFGKVQASKVRTDCHLLDDICKGGNLVLPPHLTYCLDVAKEAKFVVELSGLEEI